MFELCSKNFYGKTFFRLRKYFNYLQKAHFYPIIAIWRSISLANSYNTWLHLNYTQFLHLTFNFFCKKEQNIWTSDFAPSNISCRGNERKEEQFQNFIASTSKQKNSILEVNNKNETDLMEYLKPQKDLSITRLEIEKKCSIVIRTIVWNLVHLKFDSLTFKLARNS